MVMLSTVEELSPPNGDQTKSRFINYYRTPASEQARAFVDGLISSLLAYESSHSPRLRGRRRSDQEIFERQATAIVSDLCHDLLTEGSGLYIQRSHRAYESLNRYQPSFLTKKVTNVIDLLIGAGMVEQALGERNPFGRKVATLIKPTPAFADSVWASGLDVLDFQKAPPQETIILKQARDDYWSSPRLVDYSDNELTNRYRHEMTTINAWLAEADLGFEAPWFFAGSVDTSDRHLSRIFTGSFDRCGRLYGGFWQPLNKEVRKAGVRINGQSVSVLDYGQMIVRLAYAHVGATPPEGDAYSIAPYGEKYREGFKTLISAMLFNTGPITKKPKGTKDKLPKVKAELLCEAVREAHPAIASLFNNGVGLELMHQESEILVAVMLELRRIGVVALPVHDAVVVSNLDTKLCNEIMTSTFLRITGIEPSIKYE
jgi:hypothetical protein